VDTSCGEESISFSLYNYSSGYSFIAYPNPSSETLNVRATEVNANKVKSSEQLISKDLSQIKVKLLNEMGDVVSDGSFKKKHSTLNIHGLKPGSYFLHIGDGSDRIIRKILIEK